MMTGWSAYGGQTLSPYVGKIEPGEGIMGHSVSVIFHFENNNILRTG
jgi:hypothetical protein